jgi:hypothetical protein
MTEVIHPILASKEIKDFFAERKDAKSSTIDDVFEMANICGAPGVYRMSLLTSKSQHLSDYISTLSPEAKQLAEELKLSLKCNLSSIKVSAMTSKVVEILKNGGKFDESKMVSIASGWGSIGELDLHLSVSQARNFLNTLVLNVGRDTSTAHYDYLYFYSFETNSETRIYPPVPSSQLVQNNPLLALY